MYQALMTKEIKDTGAQRPLWIHAIVAIIYLTVTCILFIIRENPDPIGIGFLQWIFIAAHLFYILFFYLVLIPHSTSRAKHWRRFRFALAGFLGVVLLFLIFSEPISDLIWSLRES